MNEIKFECPDCSQHISAPEELLGTEIVCPGCARRVKVRRMVADSRPQQDLLVASRDPEIMRQEEADAIFTKAKSISNFAMFLFATSGIAVFVTIIQAMLDYEGYISTLVFGGSILSAALFLYLLAQIVQIRALLHRPAERRK